MSESMIEKVARALALADLDEETRGAVNLDAHMAHVQDHYDKLARAAIEAIREPTERMVSAVADEGDCYLSWRQMIDAALAEERE